MSSMGRVLILFSGGVDSTVALWKTLSEGHEVTLLNIQYHRRNPREFEAALRIASMCRNSGMITVELPFLKEIYDYEEPVKQYWMKRLNNPVTVMAPFRNIIFYSVAAHMASHIRAEKIIGGHVKEDTTTLPDANPAFIQRLNNLLAESLGVEEIKVEAPLIHMTKVEVVRLGMELKAPLNLTWSCWASGPGHCGKCPGCTTRKRVFREAGYEDKTTYLEHMEIWKP